MRPTVISTGLILCALTFVTASQQAHAMSNETLLASKGTNIISLPVAIETKKNNLNIANITQNEVEKKPEVEPVKPVEPIKYKVEPNDSLDKIAKKYQTTWVRLYNKNAQIENPDLIKVNDEIIIPLADEVLASRPMPVKSSPVVAPPTTAAPTRVRAQVASPAPTRVRAQVASPAPQPRAYASRGAVSGNTYSAGYCTWYVKNRRPDLPNNLGNADTWVARASAQGLPTGSAPRVGAVGQRGMHVVYVESVNGDGTVGISEMNREGLYVTSTRTVPASYFQYIY
jgi:peptidoglycan DL-endopeptidase CwlO